MVLFSMVGVILTIPLTTWLMTMQEAKKKKNEQLKTTVAVKSNGGFVRLSEIAVAYRSKAGP